MGWRGGGSYGSPRCWLWVGRGGALKAVPDAGCGAQTRGFSQESQTLVVVGKCGVLVAVSDTGYGGGRGMGSHGSSQKLFVRGGEAGVLGVHMASKSLVVGGEVLVLIAVPDAGCGWERRDSHGSPNRFLGGWDTGFLMTVSQAGCGWEVGVLLAVSDAGFGGRVRVFMAGPYAGCGG